MTRDKATITQTSRRLDRREAGRLFAAAGLMPVTVTMSDAAAAQGEAIYFTWPGLENPVFHPTYIEKHGAPPDCSFYADENEAFQKARQGFAIDIAQPCSPMVAEWRDAGLIQPIDVDRLAHWDQIFPSLKALPGTVADGSHWFVPWNWGRTSITYRTDLVDWSEEDSWSLLWDERYAGQIAVFDSVDETVFITAIHAGLDPCNLDEAGLDTVMALLERQRPLVRFYASTEAEVTQALASGEVVAALTWDSGAAQLRSEGVPVRFMTPREGVMTFCCGLVLARDAPHPDKAYDLIDALLSPESGEAILSEFAMGPANMVALERASNELLSSLQLPRDPTEMLEAGVMFCRLKDKEKVIDRFQQMQAGF